MSKNDVNFNKQQQNVGQVNADLLAEIIKVKSYFMDGILN